MFLPTPSQVKNKVENLESCTDEHGQPYVRVLPSAQHTKLKPETSKGILLFSEESKNKHLLAGLLRWNI